MNGVSKYRERRPRGGIQLRGGGTPNFRQKQVRRLSSNQGTGPITHSKGPFRERKAGEKGSWEKPVPRLEKKKEIKKKGGRSAHRRSCQCSTNFGGGRRRKMCGRVVHTARKKNRQMMAPDRYKEKKKKKNARTIFLAPGYL